MGKENIMIDNRGETQSKPVNFINRKIAALTVAGSMILGGVGCAEARTVDTSNNIPTSVEDTIGTSETTKLVTPEVTVTPTPTEAPIETTVAPTPEVKINAPNIEGYTNEVDTKTGLINLVNKETKEVDYIYNPNVWIGDKQVGGIAVKPDKVEEIKVSGDIIPPFNLEEITDDTNFMIENCKDIPISEITGTESNVVVMEFDTPLTLVNSCIENNQFSKIAEFTVKVSFEKENGEVIKIDSPAGLIPLSCFETGVTGIKNEYYISDVVDQNKILNFDQEKVYAIGESTDVIVKSVMSICKGFNNPENTTLDDLALTKEGNVIFSYP